MPTTITLNDLALKDVTTLSFSRRSATEWIVTIAGTISDAGGVVSIPATQSRTLSAAGKTTVEKLMADEGLLAEANAVAMKLPIPAPKV